MSIFPQIPHTKKFNDKILQTKKKMKHKSCFSVFYLGEVYFGEEKNGSKDTFSAEGHVISSTPSTGVFGTFLSQ